MTTAHDTPEDGRLAVRKTHKLYIDGAFPRSESGRSFPVTDHQGRFWAHLSQASRKDARDAVRAARSAFGGWSGRTAYNRGQVLYRVAEVMEGRRDQLESELRRSEGLDEATARTYVDAAVDRWVWYAGWCDKVAQVLGGANSVSGPYLNHSSPEPTGVVAVLAPKGPLLGLVSVVAPVIATGNTCVVVASRDHPVPAVTLAEVLATSDVPKGVVNLLTSTAATVAADIAPSLAGHLDVDGLDLTGAADPAFDADLARSLEAEAAVNLKRVLRAAAPDQPEDLLATPALSRMTTFLETKTVWHPIGT